MDRVESRSSSWYLQHAKDSAPVDLSDAKVPRQCQYSLPALGTGGEAQSLRCRSARPALEVGYSHGDCHIG